MGLDAQALEGASCRGKLNAGAAVPSNFSGGRYGFYFSTIGSRCDDVNVVEYCLAER